VESDHLEERERDGRINFDNIIIIALQSFVVPWPLFQFLDPIQRR
jgi:hypothetical protein